MAKAHTDKSRKKNLENYKTKQKTVKMSEVQAPQFKPFRQVPHWEPDAKIVITGDEFARLKDFLNIFSEPIHTMQDIFNRNLNEGVITVKYIDNENQEIPAEKVQAYMQELRDYLSKQAEDSGGTLVSETPTEQPQAATLTAV